MRRGSRLANARDIGVLGISSRHKFFRQHQHFARARHVGPVAVEIGDQTV
jgi:hypothetical protein